MYSKKLTEKKNELITRAEEVLNGAKAEERELTEAEAEELAEIRDNVRKIVKSLELDKEVTEMETEEGDDVAKDTETRDVLTNDVEVQERELFDKFIRGYINERDGELTPAQNSAGVTIPTTIADKIIKKVYDICPILERSTKYNVKGKLDIPYYDNETSSITVAYQTEFVAVTSSNGSFAKIELDGYLAGALSKISRSLINNSKFDIVAFVVDEMAYQIARFIEHELLIGTENKVTGLSTLTNVVTSASATAITSDELIDVQDSVKDVYQNDAIWIMSTSTRTAIRKLKDEMGRYLLQDDISAPFGKTLLGKPVFVSDNMPNIATKNTVIYYGDMSGLATKFSEEINIQVLREKYADEHADGVIGWFEFDSKIENEQKIAGLKMA